MEDLKPCPFCGGSKLKVDSRCTNRHRFKAVYTASVRCNKCHARGGTASGVGSAGLAEAEKAAAENWNSRIEYQVKMEERKE